MSENASPLPKRRDPAPHRGFNHKAREVLLGEHIVRSGSDEAITVKRKKSLTKSSRLLGETGKTQSCLDLSAVIKQLNIARDSSEPKELNSVTEQASGEA